MAIGAYRNKVGDRVNNILAVGLRNGDYMVNMYEVLAKRPINFLKVKITDLTIATEVSNADAPSLSISFVGIDLNSTCCTFL